MSLVVVAGLLFLVAGCACDESEPRAGAGNAQAVPGQTPQTSESDSDGDGVLDLEEAEPDDASVSSDAGRAETPERTAAADRTDCDELGINAGELNGGICQSEGPKLRVVDRNSRLKLAEVMVAYHGVSYADSLTTPVGVVAPFGRFVIVKVTVTNRGDSPIGLNATAYEMFALTLTQSNRTQTYRADFGAMNMPGPSLVWSDAASDLQPKAAVTGTVVFDVPKPRVDLVEKSGNLHVLQPSDVWSPDVPKKRQGLVRLFD
jgi:hypothetical protein